jgi:Zn-dependent membrane protease YugP
VICVSLTYVFLICTVVPLLFGLWAQFKVKSTFKRYSQVATASGMTGAQAADAVLRNSGVTGVGI